MQQSITNTIPDQKIWFEKPSAGHLVHFYNGESSLLDPLTTYISSGLLLDETCIVIASEKHIASLHTRLAEAGLDISDLQNSGRFIIYNAAETLKKFMINDLPDKQRFFDVVGGIVTKAVDEGRPVRAYGEMVALLWAKGNKAAVLQLENLWNELAENKAFSLFCAYPELHFIMNRDVIEEIHEHHNVNLPKTAIQPA